jgi:hypothetical protein
MINQISKYTEATNKHMYKINPTIQHKDNY